MAVSPGKKAAQNSCAEANRDGCDNSGPNPCAAYQAQASRPNPTASRNGAPRFSSHRMQSIPLITMAMFNAQKIMKHKNSPGDIPSQEMGTLVEGSK